VKREPVKKAQPPQSLRLKTTLRSKSLSVWLGVVAIGVLVAAAAWFFGVRKPAVVATTPQTGIPDNPREDRFSRHRPVTQETLDTLAWEDINPLLRSAGSDAVEIERLAQLTVAAKNPAATYMRGLLRILQKRPDDALATFGTLDLHLLPPAFLYAPHRLQQTQRPGDLDPYLTVLRNAIAEGRVPPLIQARVLALDGKLGESLAAYLRTDPGEWVQYDLESLQRIGMHEGLAADLRRMLGGALASGRVSPDLAERLRAIVRDDVPTPELEEFKSQLKRNVEAGTPEGTIAIASAKKLITDRKAFLNRDYSALIDSHRKSKPMILATETVLLLFLSSVEIKDRIEMDRWGQELKRRYREGEVRDWVNEMTSSAQ